MCSSFTARPEGKWYKKIYKKISFLFSNCYRAISNNLTIWQQKAKKCKKWIHSLSSSWLNKYTFKTLFPSLKTLRISIYSGLCQTIKTTKHHRNYITEVSVVKLHPIEKLEYYNKVNSACHRRSMSQSHSLLLREEEFICLLQRVTHKNIVQLTACQSSTILSRPLSFSLQASSSSWLANICRSRSLSLHATDTGEIFGEAAFFDNSPVSGFCEVKKMTVVNDFFFLVSFGIEITFLCLSIILEQQVNNYIV